MIKAQQSLGESVALRVPVARYEPVKPRPRSHLPAIPAKHFYILDDDEVETEELPTAERNEIP